MGDWIIDCRMLTLALMAGSMACGPTKAPVSNHCWMECQRTNCEAVAEHTRTSLNGGVTYTCVCGCKD